MSRPRDHWRQQFDTAAGQVAALRQQTERVQKLCDDRSRHWGSFTGPYGVLVSEVRAALDGPS